MQSSGCLLEVFGVASEDYLLHIRMIHIPNCERCRVFTVCCRGSGDRSVMQCTTSFTDSDAIKYCIEHPLRTSLDTLNEVRQRYNRPFDYYIVQQ